jgi:hypothetical protein
MFNGVNWTWVSGSPYGEQAGVYPNGAPGSRWKSCGEIDSKNLVWLFGGYGLASNSSKNKKMKIIELIL